ARRGVPGPRLDDVLLDGRQDCVARDEARVDDAPAGGRQPERSLDEHAVILGEDLRGIQLVVDALVAREERSALRTGADVEERCPPLWSVVVGVEGRVAAVVLGVVAVLVREDRLGRDDAWDVVAAREDRLLLRAVTTERTQAA